MGNRFILKLIHLKELLADYLPAFKYKRSQNCQYSISSKDRQEGWIYNYCQRTPTTYNTIKIGSNKKKKEKKITVFILAT